MDKNPTATSKSGEMHHEMDSGKTDGMVRQGAGNPGAFVFSSMLGPRITLAPPDMGGDPAPAPAPEPSTQPAPEPTPEPTPKPERPEYIPENFWDADKGFKSDDLNALVALKAEQDSRAAAVPATKDEYKVALPAEFKIEGLEIKDGESPIDENDPRISFARDFAHSQGFTQPQFEGLVALGVQMDLAEQTGLNDALKAQAEALGGKGKERIEAVTNWLGAKLGGEFAAALGPMIMTAKQVQSFERIMQLNRGAVPGNPGAGRDTGKPEMSDEDYAKLSATEKINYARQHSK